MVSVVACPSLISRRGQQISRDLSVITLYCPPFTFLVTQNLQKFHKGKKKSAVIFFQMIVFRGKYGKPHYVVVYSQNRTQQQQFHTCQTCCQPSPKPFLFVLFVFFIVNFKVRKRVCNVNFYQIAIGKKFKTWLSFKACPKGYVRVCLKSLHAQIAKGLIPLDHIFK